MFGAGAPEPLRRAFVCAKSLIQLLGEFQLRLNGKEHIS